MSDTAQRLLDRSRWMDLVLLGGCLLVMAAPPLATVTNAVHSGQSDRLWMEQRTAARFEIPTVRGLLSGAYQKAFESALGDQVARRQGVTRSYRRLQQGVAALAYAGWGAEEVQPLDGRGLWRSRSHLFEYSERSQFKPGRGGEDARTLRAVAERFPTLRFRAHLVYTSPQLDCLGRATRLTASAWLYAEEFRAGLGDRIVYSETRPATLEAYEAAFYRTDHHWVPSAAWDAYEGMARSLHLDPPLPRLPLTRLPGVVFRGTYSRFAAWPAGYDDTLGYYPHGLRFDEVLVDGRPGFRSHLDRPGAEGVPGPDVDTYAMLFGADAGEVRYRRGRSGGGRRLLLVGDSMKQTAERWLASHFEETTVVDLRHWATMAGRPFDYGEFVAANGITDVIWLGAPGSGAVFGGR